MGITYLRHTRARALAPCGLAALVALLLHIGLMASPLHGAPVSPVAATRGHAHVAEAPPAAPRATAAIQLVTLTAASASHPMPDCQLEPAPPRSGPALLAPVGAWSPTSALSPMAAMAGVAPVGQPPTPLQLADSQALLQVFRN